MSTQTEPVAAQVRYRRPEKGTPDWSAWQPAAVSTTNPAWCIDSLGYEVEYRLLYAEQPEANVELVAVLRDALELIKRGDFDTGVCCCGYLVETHGFGDGHSPVDQGGYYAMQLTQRIETLLENRHD